MIVYQVLSTDVADRLREYATFKAMGYGQPFFLGIVFEEAIVRLLGLEVHGKADAAKQRAAAYHLLDLLGLSDRRDYLPANLSGGQKQRVAVARALVSNPDIIFADEPTAALDKESGHTVVEMLKALSHVRGTTTVMVTHDNRIMEMADRIITLEDGRNLSDR